MLFVGLGNPGAEYNGTRHNIGFRLVDAIADIYGFPKFQKKFKGEYAEGDIAARKIRLIKPQTFMNRSGTSAAEAASFYKIPLEEILVAHDEIDLPIGKVRFKLGGGNGGHNGLKSLDENIGNGYQRLRIGVGHPGNSDMVSGYVLGKFDKDEAERIAEIVEIMAENFKIFVKDGRERYMSKIALEIGNSELFQTEEE